MNRLPFAVLFTAVAFVLVACGTTPAVQQGLPCDVSQVFHDRCQSCHGAQPAAGAPMPLVTYDDTQAAARSAPTQRVWQLVGQRIHDPMSPMPPAGQPALSDTERASLDQWVAAMAPRGTQACTTPDAAVDAGPPVGPQYLSCPATQQTRFVAHGDTAGSGYHVAPDAGNLYMCFTWRSTFDTPTQATAFAPIIGDRRVLHHYILFQTATPQTDGGFGPCHMPADATFLTGWAPGGVNRSLPDDVGLQLPGSDHWFILQVHYWNTAAYTDVNDTSGVAMCVTDQLRPHSAGVATLGTADIAVPPHTTPGAPYTTAGRCTPTNTAPVHIVSYGPHMHTHGLSIETRVFPGGNMTQPGNPMVSVPLWDFNSQSTYDAMPDTVVNPGDVLVTTCKYQNPSDAFIYFGERTEDEMCFDFVLAWPANALVNATGASTQRCIDRASP